MLEETNILIAENNVKVWTVENTLFPQEHKHFVTIFTISEWTEAMGEAQNLEPHKHEDWLWYRWDDLRSLNLMPGIDQLLRKGMRP